jgi:hypothetical protein
MGGKRTFGLCIFAKRRGCGMEFQNRDFLQSVWKMDIGSLLANRTLDWGARETG